MHRARRGAEQGDPHGSLQCGVVLAPVAREAMAEMQRRKGGDHTGCFAFWYCDDGQVVCRPGDVDLFLECWDAAAARAGATRGEGEEVKSLVRLVGHSAALSAFDDDWLTDRIRRTCKVGEPNAACEVLGAIVGDLAQRADFFRQRTAKVRELHGALTEVGDPAAALTLWRSCADGSRVSHLLRVDGASLEEEALIDYDAALGSFVDRALGGDLPPHALDQAVLGVSQGGLGFRRAAGLAGPAFVASRLEARPFVLHLLGAIAAAGVHGPGATELYDTQTEAALGAVLTELSPTRAEIRKGLCANAASAAAARFVALGRGDRAASSSPPVGGVQAADFLLGGLGAKDPEHPAAPEARRPRLQRTLSVLLDQQRSQMLQEELSVLASPAAQRLAELSDDTVNSEWLWAFDPAQPSSVEPDAYVAAVRLRLGAGFAEEPLPCRADWFETVARNDDLQKHRSHHVLVETSFKHLRPEPGNDFHQPRQLHYKPVLHRRSDKHDPGSSV